MMLGKLTALLAIESGGWSLIWSHYVVFLDKSLSSHSASLHPGVLMRTRELLIMQPDKMLEGSLTLD